MVQVKGIVRKRQNEMGTFGVLTSKDMESFIGKPVIANFEIDEEALAKHVEANKKGAN